MKDCVASFETTRKSFAGYRERKPSKIVGVFVLLSLFTVVFYAVQFTYSMFVGIVETAKVESELNAAEEALVFTTEEKTPVVSEPVVSSKPIVTTTPIVSHMAVPSVTTVVPPAVKPEKKNEVPVKKGSWSVQTGTFTSRASADKFLSEMKKSGFEGFVNIRSSSTGKKFYETRVAVNTKEEATALSVKMKQKGYQTMVMKNK